jgi:hypothetical protein
LAIPAGRSVLQAYFASSRHIVTLSGFQKD